MWMEKLALRTSEQSGERLQQLVKPFLCEVKADSELGITPMLNLGEPTEFVILLRHARGVGKEPSQLGLCLAQQLFELGPVEHTIWAPIPLPTGF